MANAGANDQVDLMVLDFKSAFKQLRVHPDERRFLGGKVGELFFVYSVVFFGIVSGPLVWCRVAAALMRTTQGMNPDDADIATYMDDPHRDG